MISPTPAQPVPSHTGLRQRLRTETEALHQSLHRNNGLRQLVSNQCTIKTYREVLNTFFKFYRAWDNFFTVEASHRFTHEAKPLAWLEQDFRILKETPSPMSYFVNDSYATLGALGKKSLEAYVGYLYLKQGSTLGGQTISRQLDKNLGLEAGRSQYFFYGFGANTGMYWSAFLDYLTDMEPHLDASSVIRYAKFFFELLDAAFDQHFPEEA